MTRVRWMLLGMSLLASPWVAAAPHTHGQGQALMALSGQQLTVNLSLPLDVVLGFERAPRTEKERQALQQAMDQLKQTDALWQLNSAAKCQAQPAQVEPPTWGGAGHADLDVTYTWVCAQPQALDRVEVRLFEPFKRLRRLDLNHALPGGQGAQRLTPNKPTWTRKPSP